LGDANELWKVQVGEEVVVDLCRTVRDVLYSKDSVKRCGRSTIAVEGKGNFAGRVADESLWHVEVVQIRV